MRGFEWDPEKAFSNERKHGVTFDEAALMLLGDYVELPAKVRGEARWMALARDGGEFFAIVFTRRGENIRIISARHATIPKRITYERHIDR